MCFFLQKLVKTTAKTFMADGLLLASLVQFRLPIAWTGLSSQALSSLLIFCLPWKNEDKNPKVFLKLLQTVLETCTRSRFWSTVRKRDTYFADHFFIFKWCKILCACSLEMHTAPALPRNFSLQPHHYIMNSIDDFWRCDLKRARTSWTFSSSCVHIATPIISESTYEPY